ncbi:AI-2E family transporter [Deinococcus metallilatus]|uniref:AI-2E family transporter n=1 Tax=Deinococcus metallilatus TaxID=1211322 RepID=A0AAJ5F3V2_9DEIO|nr:AI-2E family transporter [Deinococcus metallilatus]MBB5294782.1 putative PurR-regulated permease PerM [Deinococcus metallilatus]QBY09494.1 AI-2E family transporter [Deinococcus metallilatus]RXJ09499.1 AI-2E family transporter [Deinococcus metallilatus]TLK29021.1 AI-2E family transporter [Deinococcus metallilatus]GMA16708.1 AI-2E family transporter [Deinococcus metallilatus]
MISSPKAPNAFQYVWRSPWVRAAVFLLLFYLAYRLLGQIQTVVVVFAVAYLIAYLANPMLNWLERGRVKRGLGVFFVLLVFIGILALAAALVVTVSAQLITLLQSLPDQIGRLNDLLDRLFGWLGTHGVPGTDNVRTRLTEAVQTYVQNLGRNIVPLLQNLLSSTGTIFSSIVSIGGVLGQVVLILLLSIYLMLDYSRVNAALLKAFPRPWQPRVLEFTGLVGTSVGGYVRGQLVIAAFIGVFVWLGLTLIGVPSAAAIGFLAGAFNIVPYLGPVIGATPALLLALPFGWVKMLLVVVIFVAANQIEGNFLSPYILSKTTNLHPVAVLLAILVGASLFGFAGALLAVPAVALGKLVLDKYYFPSRVYTEGP